MEGERKLPPQLTQEPFAQSLGPRMGGNGSPQGSRTALFRKSVFTEHGKLTFTSVTQLDPQNRSLLISERHTLDDGQEERSYDHSFVMRCWLRDEVELHLQARGFASIDWFGAYDPAVMPGSTDRVVAIGQLPVPSA